MALARALPADLPAALFLVLHVPAHGKSVLPQLLERAGRLPAAHAKAGEKVTPGRWYVAPPDQHLVLRNGRVHLGRGPSENGHRPAVDPLFRAAASEFGKRVVGIVLSGSLDDGTAGLLAVKAAGGITVVQDPLEALYPSMPQSAIESVDIDYVLRIAEIGRLVTQLAAGSTPTLEASVEEHEEVREQSGAEAAIAADGQAAIDDIERRGVPSGFACPDCHGVLWEVREGDLVRYRCRVGHAYLPQGLSVAQAEQLEESLWIALRTLKESGALSTRLARRAREGRLERMAITYESRAREAEQRAKTIEDVLKRGRLSASLEDAEAVGSEASVAPVAPAES